MPVANGRFGQISGLCFSYDIDAAVGSRVTGVFRHTGGICTATVVDLSAGSLYTLAINDFMASGGDDYPDVAGQSVTRNVMDQDVAAYITANSPISPMIEDRISCVGATCPTPSP